MQYQLTLRDHGYGMSVSRGVPVYSPAFAGIHCAYPWRDGQAELTRVAGYIPRWCTRLQTVTHPSTNRARHRVTSLITTNTLTTTPHINHYATPPPLTYYRTILKPDIINMTIWFSLVQFRCWRLLLLYVTVAGKGVASKTTYSIILN